MGRVVGVTDIAFRQDELKPNISRLHCTIEETESTFNIWDEGSLNGTFLNGERLKALEAVPLHDEDVIQLGQLEYGGIELLFRNYNLDEIFTIDSTVGNYTIIKKIGDGGIGSVFLARHKILNYPSAIKIHQHFPDNDVVGVAFLQAANYLSQLNHPNIVRLFDFGFSHGHAYIAMEYIDGHTLNTLIPRSRSKEWISTVSEYFIQLLSAVRHAHTSVYLNLAGEESEGIIHGDIKPQNILIGKDVGLVKLTDFMIPDVQEYLGKEVPDFEKLLAPYVKPLSRREKMRLYKDSVAALTRRFGTPGYMSPEQMNGKVSIKTDIYTLGATLYELLTNLPPLSLFEGINPRKVNPFVPKWMEEVIITSMQSNPADRYYSVAEIETIFREHVAKTAGYFVNFIIKELLMGDKIDISMGDITEVKGQLFIGKFNEVVANLNSIGKSEYAEALKNLKEAVMASTYLTDEQKKEHIEVINKIGEEAAKEKSNKVMLKSLGDGLLHALKAIPDVAKAIAAVAPFFSSQ